MGGLRITMKFSIYFLGIIFLFSPSSLFAAPKSQCRVNYYCENKPVKTCIKEMAAKCDLKFIDSNIPDLDKPVMYQIDNLTLDLGVSVLVQTVSKASISVEIDNKNKTLKVLAIPEITRATQPPQKTTDERLPPNSKIFTDPNDPDLKLKYEDTPMIPSGSKDGAATSINDFNKKMKEEPPYNPREEGVIPPASPGGSPRTIDEYSKELSSGWEQGKSVDEKMIPSGVGDNVPLSKKEFEEHSNQYRDENFDKK